MNDNDIRVILEMIVPRLLKMIGQKENLSEIEALNQLYNSGLYHTLEREDTKLWHFSVPTLYALWKEEKETGMISFPEEAA